MSTETAEWLNRNVLVGFTDKRGKAWHYKESAQGDEPNHYPGAIPVPDVLRRLFFWQAVELPVVVKAPIGDLVQEDRKAIARNDTYKVFGLFKSGYRPHQYCHWLLDNVANILDDSLAIGSSGLLKGGAVAWVSVEVPDNIVTPEGVEFRPNLFAGTSFDGTLATTYKRMVTNVVCDNTMAIGLGEQGQLYKVKHSKYSDLKIADAREALGVVYSIADDFAAEVARLCQWEVTDAQWDDVLAALVPIDEDNRRSVTVGDEKRGILNSLYRHDNRCEPWQGTAWGVVQTFNTYDQHYKQVRGDTIRVERNMSETLSGKVDEANAQVIAMLSTITDHEWKMINA